MTIVCGTDLSDNAAAAAQVAAMIAKRMGASLTLVHAVYAPAPELQLFGPHDALYNPQRARLRAQADALAAQLGIEVELKLVADPADEALCALATGLGAHMIVVASLGRRAPARWLLGSVAERVAQSSRVPVLVVRDTAPFAPFTRGERPLRVMVGAEATPGARAALDWARGLRAIGPCELTVAQILWPAGLQPHATTSNPMPLDHLSQEHERELLGALETWAGEPPAPARERFLVRAGLGRVGSHLALLAQAERTNLLVVGTHQRALIPRLWQGSVSRAVLHEAPMNVACVPLT